MSIAAYHSILFGPIRSRRFGTSLGINLTPTPRTECGPDCLHCKTAYAASVPIVSRAHILPSSGLIVTNAARRIIEIQRAGEKLESLAVSGTGDPTMHPNLLEISENLRDLKAKWFPKAKLNLLSPSQALSSPELRAVCVIYDRAVFAFEWGTAKTYDTFRPNATLDYKTLVDRLQGLDRWSAQATFVQGALDNSSDREVQGWMKKIEELRPREVYLLTTEGKAKAGIKSVPLSKLEEISAKLVEKTGIPGHVVTREAQPA
ncbi:MAG: hypothetical protein NTV21_04425 [Planctomycetota bacterium]|nr:hypothetical protein [Planctomycetota bacterium]